MRQQEEHGDGDQRGDQRHRRLERVPQRDDQDAAADGRSAFVADYRAGIYRLDADGRATLVAGSQKLRGIDGLTRIGNRLYAIINGSSPHRVVRLDLDAAESAVSAMTIVDAARADFDEPTNGTAHGDTLLYIANSGWPRFATGGAVTAPVPAVTVLAVR